MHLLDEELARCRVVDRRAEAARVRAARAGAGRWSRRAGRWSRRAEAASRRVRVAVAGIR